jgi:hypothetical protein
MNQNQNSITDQSFTDNINFSLIMIPYKLFNGHYYTVLFTLAKQGHITKPEQRLMYELSKFTYKDGKCNPKQGTLAWKMGISKRRVIDILSSLRKKKLIEVKSPGLLERHIDQAGNEYFFLLHECYNPFLKSKQENVHLKTSPQNDNYTFYKNKDNKKTPYGPAGAFLKKENNYMGKFAQKIQDCCRGVHRFNVHAFIKKYQKAWPQEAIKQTLIAVWQKMKSCKNIAEFKLIEWWGYAMQTLKRIGGNMNEQKSIQESQAYKNITLPDQLT